VNFELTEEQKILKTTARDFLTNRCPSKLVKEMMEDEKGYPVELWREMAELGWLGLIAPEMHNGVGGSILDLGVLLEEMGRVCLPSPFFSSAVCGTLILIKGGNQKQKQELLPQIVSGERIITLALTESSGGFDASTINTKAGRTDSGYTIDGIKLPVPYAHVSDYVICAARTGQQTEEITLFLVSTDCPEISQTPLKSITGDKQFKVTFNGVKVSGSNIIGSINQGVKVIQDILPQITIAKCLEMVGGAQKAFEITVAYAKERTQSGHPIGAFQAIQHHCANMIILIDHARFLIYKAAWMLSEGLPCTMEVAAAKSFMNETYRRIIFLAHQIHGGYGFQQDHDLPLYFKQAEESGELLGNSDYHLEIVAKEIGL
jgi:alkylation response protein AidB-like acyl-CoA dehydrogenase